MSYSETITRTDLANILNEVLPSPTLNPWALLDASGFTGNNTATKVTGTTTRSGGNASEYFDTSTPDQITIKKSGLYKVTCVFGLSATSNVSNVKRIACYANGNESAVALSRTQSWENVMSFVTRTYSKDDVLTMYRRAEDGNSTYSQATILVEALHASSGNIRAEADYIVEQGTSGIWTYRKWNSGIAECWGTYAGSIAVNTSSAVYGGYRSAEIVTGAFPFTFITTNFMSATMTTGGQGAWVNNIRNVNNSAHFYLSAGSSLAKGDRGVYIYIKGTWK